MKIEEILKYEAANRNSIYLFKEGIFLRAYEQSAMRFVEYIADFHVFKKHFKIVNADVCYLGFPYKSFSALFEKKGIANFSETSKFVVVNGCPSRQDFAEWKRNIQLPTADDIRPQVLLRPDVTPKDLQNLQIFKRGYDIMVDLHRYAETMPRAHRYTIGARIKEEAIKLGVSTYRIGKNREVGQNWDAAVESIEVIRLLLRLLVDLKQISMRYFESLNMNMEYLYLSLTKGNR